MAYNFHGCCVETGEILDYYWPEIQKITKFIKMQIHVIDAT